MSQGYLNFGGYDSRNFGVYITGSGVYNAPERGYDFIEIPGRSGDLIGNERRYRNLELTYPAFIYRDFKTNMQTWRSALLATTGYKKLRDSYYPDEFRFACFYAGVEVEPTARGDAGSFDLTFYCKPQRYLDSGQTAIAYTTSGQTLVNPTPFNALPLIRVDGVGTLTIGDYSLTITAADSYTDIDSDTMECFKGTVSKNDYVVLTDHKFPELKFGENAISWTEGITRVQIQPRWWLL